MFAECDEHLGLLFQSQELIASLLNSLQVAEVDGEQKFLNLFII